MYFVYDFNNNNNNNNHHGRVAGEGRRVVAPPCPRSTARLQSSPIGRVESFRSWSSHLFVYFIHQSTLRKRYNFTRKTQFKKNTQKRCGLNGQHRAVPLKCSQNVTQHSEYKIIKNLRRRCYWISHQSQY